MAQVHLDEAASSQVNLDVSVYELRNLAPRGGISAGIRSKVMGSQTNRTLSKMLPRTQAGDRGEKGTAATRRQVHSRIGNIVPKEDYK